MPRRLSLGKVKTFLELLSRQTAAARFLGGFSFVSLRELADARNFSKHTGSIYYKPSRNFFVLPVSRIVVASLTLPTLLGSAIYLLNIHLLK